MRFNPLRGYDTAGNGCVPLPFTELEYRAATETRTNDALFL